MSSYCHISTTASKERALGGDREIFRFIIPFLYRGRLLPFRICSECPRARGQSHDRDLLLERSDRPLAAGFEKAHPGTKVEVQNRNTAAAVTFIQETKSNPPDLFWASAPDAFEVLKKNSLLQKYKPKAGGIATKRVHTRSTIRIISTPALPHPVTASSTIRAISKRTICPRRRNGTTSRNRFISAMSASRRRRAPARRISPSKPSCRAKAGIKAGPRCSKSAET